MVARGCNFCCLYIAHKPLRDLSIARAFAVTGLPPLMTVRQQRDPDPDFPTLPFPNPEEKGALVSLNVPEKSFI